MKHLNICSAQFQGFITNYQTWLETVGYSEATCYNLPIYLQEFFYRLESQSIQKINHLDQQQADKYFEYLRNRPNQRKHAGLGNNYLAKHTQSIKLFFRYLREARQTVIDIKLPVIGQTEPERNVFTKADIEALYLAIDDTDTLGIRDRAMMGIYYGCGLRRGEGVALNTGDLLLHKSLVCVRRSKNGRQRYVPVHGTLKADLQTWLRTARKKLLRDTTCQAFFLSEKGRRLQGQSLNLRLKKLVKKAGINREDASLHTLRHSIATHLLQSGMKLEDIALLLGHKSLEATQIYTHLSTEMKEDINNENRL
jgi:integrase/recombinase XerD